MFKVVHVSGKLLPKMAVSLGMEPAETVKLTVYLTQSYSSSRLLCAFLTCL